MTVEQIYTGCLAEAAYYIESNGEALMIFKYLHIARTDEVQNMLDFSTNLLKNMNLKDAP